MQKKFTLIEATLDKLLPESDSRLEQAARYALLGKGKRLRPLLTLCTAEAFHTPLNLEAAVQESITLPSSSAISRLKAALVPACAIEMIHAYSLVHDDLPCMDDDTLRRGKPTVHVEFDEATALLAGDALQGQAFQLLAEHRLADDPAAQLEMIQRFAVACGSRGMAGGQAIDLESVGKALTLPELENMHIHKTGALIRASVLLGARCGRPGGADDLARLDRYAKCVGLAFQVVDDILDEEADSATLGKTAGKDREAGKPTYTSLMGIAGARAFAAELLAGAREALAPFDGRADRLRSLADFIVKRDR